jgi:hypothetical protein
MASDAQIAANIRNAALSTGPRSTSGKSRSARNALKHGLTATTVMPVLPQQDAKLLEANTREALADRRPRTVEERDTVCRLVRLEWQLDMAERITMSHLAHRVRVADQWGPGNPSPEEVMEIQDLGNRLFFLSAVGPGYPKYNPEDFAAVIVRRLESSAEGCRWLLARWAELLNVVDVEAAWGEPEIIRMLALMGKRGIEAYFDPQLDALLHAFDVLGNDMGHRFWKNRRDGLPLGYTGGFHHKPYRAITPPFTDVQEAYSLICSIVEKQGTRLEALLARHQEVEAAQAAERRDRAALDCSPEFERHRRYQSALQREIARSTCSARCARRSWKSRRKT